MKLIRTIALLLLCYSSSAQKYLTQSARIRFFSETPVENIEAINNQVSSVLNLENGEMAFSLLMKAFLFEKALMQEHFNEKYVESDTYPKASFKGAIENFKSTDISESPKEFKVKGKLTIHGVTRDITTTKKIWKTPEGKISGTSTFVINLKDFNIKIPSTVKDNISETIEITVTSEYEKMG